jgi:hypothetical protein
MDDNSSSNTAIGTDDGRSLTRQFPEHDSAELAYGRRKGNFKDSPLYKRRRKARKVVAGSPNLLESSSDESREEQKKEPPLTTNPARRVTISDMASQMTTFLKDIQTLQHHQFCFQILHVLLMMVSSQK